MPGTIIVKFRNPQPLLEHSFSSDSRRRPSLQLCTGVLSQMPQVKTIAEGECRPGKISNRKSNDLVLKRKDEAAGAEWIQGWSAYKKGATSPT